MADVERERVTALWREAAAALESGDYYYDHETGRYVYAPDRSAVDTCAECGRLREQLDAARQTLAEELEQKAEAVIRASVLREQLDEAHKRLSSIRPLTGAEWDALMREHDVVEAARRLCKRAGETTSTRDLARALERYYVARAAALGVEGEQE